MIFVEFQSWEMASWSMWRQSCSLFVWILVCLSVFVCLCLFVFVCFDLYDFWGLPILRRGWLIYVEAGLLSRHFSSPTAAFFILTDLHWFSISATFYQRLRVDYSRYKTKIYYSKSPRAETITAENGKEISTFWGRWKILYSIPIKLIFPPSFLIRAIHGCLLLSEYIEQKPVLCRCFSRITWGRKND